MTIFHKVLVLLLVIWISIWFVAFGSFTYTHGRFPCGRGEIWNYILGL